MFRSTSCSEKRVCARSAVPGSTRWFLALVFGFRLLLLEAAAQQSAPAPDKPGTPYQGTLWLITTRSVNSGHRRRCMSPPLPPGCCVPHGCRDDTPCGGRSLQHVVAGRDREWLQFRERILSGHPTRVRAQKGREEGPMKRTDAATSEPPPAAGRLL